MASSDFNFPDYTRAFGGDFKGADAFSDKYKDFNYQPSKDSGKFDVGKGLTFLSKFLEKQGQDKYRDKYGEFFQPRTLGEVDTRGFGGSKMFDNFSIYSAPPSHSPFFIPGQGGGRGGFSGGGAASGALSGAATGAALGTAIPVIGNIGGAIAGAIIGGASGGFG